MQSPNATMHRRLVSSENKGNSGDDGGSEFSALFLSAQMSPFCLQTPLIPHQCSNLQWENWENWAFNGATNLPYLPADYRRWTLLQNCSGILILCMHSPSHTHSFYSLLFPMDILFRTIKEAWWVHNPHNYYGYHGDPFSPPSLHPMLLMVILTVLYAMITCGPVPVAMRLSLWLILYLCDVCF